MKMIDMTGQVIGKLTVIGRAIVNDKHGQARWVCTCACGNKTIIRGSELRHGGQKSCGCSQTVGAAAARRTHGMSGTSLHRLWRNMINRCERAETHNFHRYGGRGIRVCDEWRKDATAFISWCQSNGYKHGLELDRRDNDAGYSPDNCRFVTRLENARNKSRISRRKS